MKTKNFILISLILIIVSVVLLSGILNLVLDEQTISFNGHNNLQEKCKYDSELADRCASFEKLFDDTVYPITCDVLCCMSMTHLPETENVMATTYELADTDTKMVVFNPKYVIQDETIIHELCHVALLQYGIDSDKHDSEEWIYLCDHFKSMGYDIYVNGISYTFKVSN